MVQCSPTPQSYEGKYSLFTNPSQSYECKCISFSVHQPLKAMNVSIHCSQTPHRAMKVSVYGSQLITRLRRLKCYYGFEVATKTAETAMAAKGAKTAETTKVASIYKLATKVVETGLLPTLRKYYYWNCIPLDEGNDIDLKNLTVCSCS